MLPVQLGDRHARISLLDETDDLLGAELTLLYVRPIGLTNFTASRGTAQRAQLTGDLPPTAVPVITDKVRG